MFTSLDTSDVMTGCLVWQHMPLKQKTGCKNVYRQKEYSSTPECVQLVPCTTFHSRIQHSYE